MPSIQLATVDSALRAEALSSDRYELYVDFAGRIGINLYNLLSNAGGFVEEWIFAHHYFGPETGNDLSGFKTACPRIGLGSQDTEIAILDALCVVAGDFLEQALDEVERGGHDVVGFSLTISQLAASMALARLIKLRRPETHVVFGGTACAGPMGTAILRVCPYVDAVVRCEAEGIFPQVVRHLRRHESLQDVPGVTWRHDGVVEANPVGPLHRFDGSRPSLDFDPYFARLRHAGIRDTMPVWLPFEGSRGCWYGEKVQCNFCGLHEIMSFRTLPWEHTLAELERWEKRYGVARFFAVDLIMPRDFKTTLLPAIRERGHDWTIFYEVKANLRRAELEALAASGVRWIQPGIESLEGGALRRMRKGVTPLQNIQLLKWCHELDIRVSWNIILGLPGDEPAGYATIVDRARALFHLEPAQGASPFQLHRFSPYFMQPHDHGILPIGAHPLYREIFPVNRADLDDLVYLHGYTMSDAAIGPDDYRAVSDAISEWQAAYARGAQLVLETESNGAAQILDSRGARAKRIRLDSAETALYRFLDSARSEATLARRFAEASPAAARQLAAADGVEGALARWKRQRLVITDAGRVLAVATCRPGKPNDTPAPLSYLADGTPEPAFSSDTMPVLII
ncbi:RiPP maturation radical SAM protein 1 [Acrocarpospora pleiomorpha]|uniref:RiPP maturation radical SAM protein 1 n=2 Tax=Acrocarpospora pleiomorpha TaxID=90975 RepID=A0A5M3XM56_9ACTN|nr:RiPP maturation radical SAM protein 1 [Acrocarpospora pleiomorpha]